MNVLFIGLSAFLGGLIASVLGYLKSGEYFELRKFLISVITAFLSAVVFVTGYNYLSEVTPVALCSAFLAGAGVDVLRNRIDEIRK